MEVEHVISVIPDIPLLGCYATTVVVTHVNRQSLLQGLSLTLEKD